MSYNKIALASNNAKKIKELKSLLNNIEVLTLKDLNLESPEETGNTFEENSLIKSKYIFEKTGLPSIADDSGFCIDCFGGFPGLYSSRFGDANGYENAFGVIAKCINQANKKASFKTCISFVYRDIQKTFFGEIKGMFSYPPRGANGFGYDSIFIPDGHSKTFAEMTDDEKSSMSHRGIAMGKFAEFYNELEK